MKTRLELVTVTTLKSGHKCTHATNPKFADLESTLFDYLNQARQIEDFAFVSVCIKKTKKQYINFRLFDIENISYMAKLHETTPEQITKNFCRNIINDLLNNEH